MQCQECFTLFKSLFESQTNSSLFKSFQQIELLKSSCVWIDDNIVATATDTEKL
eukprot:m.98652 g.98652  ORF g.98652 m.98652 type:complete len:54 (+) comp12526_c2_seq5:290-451(+)